MNNSKTIYWINAAKAISIIAVYFIHTQLCYECMLDCIDRFVYTWYVNAFFFVSGYLLFWKQLTSPKIDENRNIYITSGGRSLFQNIVFRIVIPSIIFSTIEFVPSCIIQGRGIDIGFALFKTIGGGTYWFTSALVVSELILLGLFCTRERNIWFYAAISFLLGVVGLMVVKFEVFQNGIWAWRQGVIALIYLAIGGLYWRYEKHIDKLKKWCFALPLSVIYVFFILFCKNNNPLISTLQIQPFGFLTSTIACLLLVWLCKMLPEMKYLIFIGRNTIGFYFMSGALPVVLSLFVHKFLSVQSQIGFLLVFVGSFVIGLCAVYLMNRFVPWLFDLRVLWKKQEK